MKTQSKHIPRGFTLVELLVAMAITTVIVTILVSITSLALETFNRNRSEIRAARQGKAMVDSLAEDLQALVIRSGNNFEWLYAKSEIPSGGLNNGSNKSPNAIDLVFFSAVTDRYNGEIGETGDNGGDISTLAYKLVYQDPIDSAASTDFGTFVLYRKLLNPDATFNETLGTEYQSDAGAELLQSAENAVNLNSTTGNTASEIEDNNNFICENIYQFSMVFHVDVKVEQGDGTFLTISVPIPIDQSEFFKVTGSKIIVDPGFSSSLADSFAIESGTLSAIEVSLTVLSDFGVEQMRKRTFANDTEMNEFVAENSYQYSKLVLVPSN